MQVDYGDAYTNMCTVQSWAKNSKDGEPTFVDLYGQEPVIAFNQFHIRHIRLTNRLSTISKSFDKLGISQEHVGYFIDIVQYWKFVYVEFLTFWQER